MSEMVVGRTYRRHNNNLSRFCPLSCLSNSFLISIYDVITGLRELINVAFLIRYPVYLILTAMCFLGNDISNKVSI